MAHWARCRCGMAGWPELKDRYRLISVDLPGHGLTGDWPRGEFSVEAYADFIEVLADTLHLDRFAVAGHSLGGAVAWTFAATRPERVSQLILVDSAGFPREDGELPLADPARPPTGDRRHRNLFQAGATGTALAARDVCRSGDGDARAGQAIRRTAALSRQPPGHPGSRPHPGAARSDAAQAARRADADHSGARRTAGCRWPTPSASRTTSRAPSSRSSRSWATTPWKKTPRRPPPRSPSSCRPNRAAPLPAPQPPAGDTSNADQVVAPAIVPEKD